MVYLEKLDVSGWKQWTDIYALSTSGENYGIRMLDAWTPTNTGSTIPAMSINNYNDEGRFSTYYVESGSYSENPEYGISYTIPKYIGKVKMSKSETFIESRQRAYLEEKPGAIMLITGLDPTPNPQWISVTIFYDIR